MKVLKYILSNTDFIDSKLESVRKKFIYFSVNIVYLKSSMLRVIPYVLNLSIKSPIYSFNFSKVVSSVIEATIYARPNLKLTEEFVL